MKKYSTYKDSGVEWIGDIPSHWNVIRLKYLLSGKLKYGANESAEFADKSMPRYIRITDFGDDGKLRDDTFRSLPMDVAAEYLLCEGDILFARSGATVGKTFQFKDYNGDACFAGYLIKATPNPKHAFSDFLYYYTRSKAYENWKNSVFIQATIQNIGADKYQNLMVSVSDIDEQRVIADFLDDKTAKIDKLIDTKRKQIELLKEQRTAVINQAVTKGLDPNAEMKDSGIPWMPKIAKHWKPVKLGYYIDLLPGFAFPSSDFSHSDDDIKLLRGINIAPGAIRWDETVYWSADEYEALEQFQLKQGDIVIGMDRPWVSKGMRVAQVKENDIPCLLLQRVARLRAKPPLTQQFLSIILSSKFFVDYFSPILTGVSVPHISPTQIMSFRFGLPPENELSDIIDYLSEKFIETDATISKAEKQIELLTEYRTALISEAVTGKIDVRKAV